MNKKHSLVSLHNHTSMGSPMDAIIDVKDYITQARLLNATSIGISDHGSMASWIEFQDHCKKNGIKPIAGCEFHAHLASDPKSKKSYHVLVIAKNEIGWRNLLKLNHLSNTVSFFTKPRISEKMIFEHKEGLLVGNACISGFVTRHLMNDDEISARILAEEFRNELGHNYFFELMAHDNPTQAKINRQLMQIAKDLDIQVGITLDTHFKDMSYEEAYLLNGRNRRGITQSMIENNPPEDCLLSADFTSKDCECIIDALVGHGLDRKDILAAMDYTVQIDKEINFEFKDKFELPEISKNPNEDLEKMLGQRLIKKFGGKNLIPNEYKNRLREEYEITKKKGFCQYFLLLIDIIDYCKSQDYMIGPGRGSAGGSLMAYILGITNVDPILYKLPFERFDSIYRSSMLDIDVDISPNDRPKVLEWLKTKYGNDNVVQMITFGEIKAKAAIKEVAKYMEIPFQEVNKICAAIPSLHYDDEGALTDVELTEALLIPEVAKYKRENPKLFELALKLEHSFKSVGCHAGAVILCPKPVYEIAPTAVKKSDGDMLMVGYDKKGCEKVGLVKMDLLGLQTLDVIKECMMLTGIHTDDIPLDDKKTWEFISDSKSLRGVFQLAENHTKKYLREIRPNNMTELGIINSAMRPGSDYTTFARNKKAGVNKPEVDREIVRETLQDTNGALIFQDDLMFLISNLSDMNLGEADLMRRALEKSDKEKVEHYKSKFISTCKYPDEAEKIFHWLEEKVGYAFCLAQDSKVSLADGTKKNIQDVVPGEILLSVNEKTGQIVENKTAGSIKMGDKKVYKVKTKSGKELICTPDHRILTENGYKTLNELVVGGKIKTIDATCLSVDDEIVSIEEIGLMPVYDIMMESEPHNFIAEDVVVHNCKAHAIAYSIIGYWTAYYKCRFSNEFLVANIKNPKSNNKFTETEYVAEFIEEARKMGLKIKPPDINHCQSEVFYDEDSDTVYLGLSSLKGITGKPADVLIEALAHVNQEDDLEKRIKTFCDYCFEYKVETEVVNKDGSKRKRAVVTKAHIRTMLNIGFFGDPMEAVPVFNKLYKEKFDVMSLREATNLTLGFDYYSMFDYFAKNIQHNKANQVIAKCIGTKTGSKNGRNWALIKWSTETGEMASFVDNLKGICNDSWYLVDIDPRKTTEDKISALKWKLIQ